MSASSTSVSRLCRWAPALPVLAAVASLLRWLDQGTRNLWSKLSLQIYTPDPVLGWRRTADGYFWIGLELILAVTLTAIAVAAASRWLARRDQRGRGALATLWIAAIAPLSIPIAAFAQGSPPDDARETLPPHFATLPYTGASPALGSLPAGRYRSIDHPDSAVTATLEAGGETFSGRFAGDLRGTWIGDPGDLAQPMQARFSVASASVDTGLARRSEHARRYLHVDEHPTIQFALRRIRDANLIAGRSELRWSGDGDVQLMGERLSVEASGSARALAGDDKDALGVETERPVLLVKAHFTLDVAGTPLGDADLFSTTEIPIQVVLLLQHQPKEEK